MNAYCSNGEVACAPISLGCYVSENKFKGGKLRYLKIEEDSNFTIITFPTVVVNYYITLAGTTHFESR